MVVQPTTTLAPKEELLGPLIEMEFWPLYEIDQYFTFDLENKDQVINIFNKIAETKAGRDILMTLKTLLGDPPNNRKIEFKIEKQGSLVEKTKGLLNDPSISNEVNAKVAIKKMDQYTKAQFIGTVNKYAMDATTNSITVSINEKFLYHERFVFDGEKIVAINLKKMLGSKKAVEAYLVAHELVHCIQFLSNKDNVMHKAAATDWQIFFQADRMQPIYNKLKAKHSDGDIYQAFTNLFENVEEARNLLGFVPENRQDLPAIGEFFLFNEKNNFYLPVYHDIEVLTQEQQATCKDVLTTIAKELSVNFQNGSMTAEGRVVASNGGFA